MAGNYPAQIILENISLFSQYLMGIGYGTGAARSGEGGIIKSLCKKVRGPLCVFDIGANKGQFLNLAIECLAGREFDIHCFEPSRKTFDILVNETVGGDRIHFNNFGMGKESGEALLFYEAEGSGMASLTKRRLDHFSVDFSVSEKVSICTIDEYCRENDVSRINLLKIDIEGHELDALMGADNMIIDGRVDYISFEFGGCNIDTKTYFQDFWYFLKEKGYSIFRVTPSGYLFPVKKYREIYEQFRTTNFVAMRTVLLDKVQRE